MTRAEAVKVLIHVDPRSKKNAEALTVAVRELRKPRYDPKAVEELLAVCECHSLPPKVEAAIERVRESRQP